MKKNVENIAKELEITDENGQFMVSSLVVAQRFDKRHDNVLDAIRKAISECSPEFGLLNFKESSYINEQGKEQPMYLLTKNGFSYVAMRFSGKKAAMWRETYIDAFDKMEIALLDKLQRQVALKDKKMAALKAGNKKLKQAVNALECQLSEIESWRYHGENKGDAVIEGLLAYWAYLDGIELETAKNILFEAVGTSEDGKMSEHWMKCYYFIQNMIHKPLQEGEKATKKQYAIMLALVDACNNLKFSKGKDHLKVFLNEYDNNFEHFDNLSLKGAERFIHLLYAHFQGVINSTSSNNAIESCLIRLKAELQ